MTATVNPPRLDPTSRGERPLVLLASLAGAAAAASTLVTAMAVGVVGWFVTDSGAHGAPRDALQAGAVGWLMGHGSGTEVSGVAVTAIPLGVTLVCALVTWRFGLRLGETLASHGPDATALSDGERDWTVPVGTSVFAATYAIIAVLTWVLAGAGASALAVVGWSLLLAGGVGGSAIAIGSGRAAVWLSQVPPVLRAGAADLTLVVRALLAASAVLLVVALVLDWGAAANVLSRLHLDTGDAVLFVLLSLLLLPNAVLFSAAYLLGPGFTVGTGTVVSPTLVALGPVPMFPLLAALPDNGPTPGWTPALLGVPVLCALLGVAWGHHRDPSTAWDQGAVRGVTAGVGAAVVIGLLCAVAGGAVGPGRMADVGPFVGDVFVHAIVSLGLGGLLGGLLATWWHRRRLVPEPGARDDSA